jgi:hypothetical protein
VAPVEHGETIRIVTAYGLDAGQKQDYLSPALARGVKVMKKKPIVMPKFVNEAQEADWWASREGREFVKQKAAGTGKKASAPRGSRLVGQLNKVASVQIALRLPEPDVAKAREPATRKGIGYQTLLKCWCMKGYAAKRAGREIGGHTITSGPRPRIGARSFLTAAVAAGLRATARVSKTSPMQTNSLLS